MLKAYLIGALLLILAAACGERSNTEAASIRGEWKIVQTDPPFPHFQNDTAGLDALALFVLAGTGDSLMPSMITINDRTLVLKSATLNLDSVDYSISEQDGSDFTLKTPDRMLHLLLYPADDATLLIAGVTYRLQRTERRK